MNVTYSAWYRWKSLVGAVAAIVTMIGLIACNHNDPNVKVTKQGIPNSDGVPSTSTDEAVRETDTPRRSIYESIQCPDGHETIKAVPIVYGLLIWEDAEAVKRSQEAIDNYEFWPGGCTSAFDSPTHRYTCTTCGFGYDSEFLTWSREDEDPSTFVRPFSEKTLSFPMPKGTNLKDSPEYGQRVYNDKVASESLSYTSLAGQAEVVNAINNWFKTIGIEPGYSEQEFTTSWGVEKRIAEWGSENMSVMLHHFKQKGESWVLLHVNRDRSNLEALINSSH